MSGESPEAHQDEAASGEKTTKKRKPLLISAGIALCAVVLLGVLRAGDIIDLPAWANVPGVDLPIIGDKDAIDCRLSIADADATPIRIKIDIVDGDKATHADYAYVWNNGNLVDDTVYERLADDELIVPVQDTEATEQFFSVSIEPVREGRVFCESITIR